MNFTHHKSPNPTRVAFPCEMDFSPLISESHPFHKRLRWDSETCGEKNPSHMENHMHIMLAVLSPSFHEQITSLLCRTWKIPAQDIKPVNGLGFPSRYSPISEAFDTNELTDEIQNTNGNYFFLKTINLLWCVDWLLLFFNSCWLNTQSMITGIMDHSYIPGYFSHQPHAECGGRRSPAVACWASDHWVASSNPLRGKFRH